MKTANLGPWKSLKSPWILCFECAMNPGPSEKVSEGVNRKPRSKSSFFLGRRHISTSGFAATATETAVFCLMYCGETVHPREKLSEGVNRKPGSNNWFFGSPPYFHFRFRRYGHRDGRFCLIFARTAQQSVLDSTNGVSSSKPCAYCQIVRPFKWTVNAYSFALRVMKAYVRNCSNLRPYDCIRTVELMSHVSRQACL